MFTCTNRKDFLADLLPFDIKGVNIYHPHFVEFQFLPAPLFTDVLLWDEINRALPVKKRMRIKTG
ncbi:MAG: AAA family ATPase [bacterium]